MYAQGPGVSSEAVTYALDLNEITLRVFQVRKRNPPNTCDLVRYQLSELAAAGSEHRVAYRIDVFDCKGNVCETGAVGGWFHTLDLLVILEDFQGRPSLAVPRKTQVNAADMS